MIKNYDYYINQSKINDANSIDELLAATEALQGHIDFKTCAPLHEAVLRVGGLINPTEDDLTDKDSKTIVFLSFWEVMGTIERLKLHYAYSNNTWHRITPFGCPDNEAHKYNNAKSKNELDIFTTASSGRGGPRDGAGRKKGSVTGSKTENTEMFSKRCTPKQKTAFEKAWEEKIKFL